MSVVTPIILKSGLSLAFQAGIDLIVVANVVIGVNHSICGSFSPYFLISY